MDCFDFTRSVWDKNAAREYTSYLESVKREDKVEWTRKILNTSRPLLALTTPKLRSFAKSIFKGNYRDFLKLKINDYYEQTFINGLVISMIKDVDERSSYFEDYFPHVDSWATCDNLDFSVSLSDAQKQWEKMKEYIADSRPFVRRIGVRILFAYIDKDEYLPAIFDICDGFELEKEYYVNMCVAWLICELFIKRRQETLEYLKRHKLNAFTINKSVQKCRDSFRVSEADKQMLKEFIV